MGISVGSLLCHFKGILLKQFLTLRNAASWWAGFYFVFVLWGWIWALPQNTSSLIFSLDHFVCSAEFPSESSGSFSSKHSLFTWHLAWLLKRAGVALHNKGLFAWFSLEGFFYYYYYLFHTLHLFGLSMKSWWQSLLFSHFTDRFNLRVSLQVYWLPIEFSSPHILCWFSFWKWPEDLHESIHFSWEDSFLSNVISKFYFSNSCWLVPLSHFSAAHSRHSV